MPELFGFGIEVYLIIVILAIPVYFLWRWIFKRSKNETSTKITIWIATIISTPVVYGLLIVIWIFIMEYYPNRDFDRHQWATNKNKRYEYSKDIIQSKMLIGKTKMDVKQILGDEGNLITNDYWYYYLGNTPGLLNVNEDELFIEFKNNKVISVEQHGTN